MENEFNHPAVDSPSSPSDYRHSSGKSRSPPARSPFDSPAESSISSYQSSLSHGFSPREDHAPELPPAAAPVENRFVRNDHHSAGKSRSPPARSPLDSPAESSISSHQSSLSHGFSPREDHAPESPPATVPAANRYVRSEPKVVTKPDPGVGTVDEVGEGGKGRPSRPSMSILRRSNREAAVKKAALGFRAFGFVFCLISLSVMSADKNQGWALDSFYRYKEFRYSVSVNVIGFVYSGVQGIDLAYQLATGKYVFQHRLRYYLIFAIDQMLSYLLMSASSSAVIRVEDWESNWGKDKFPAMARASVGMSFMAFVALAFSSLISGYSLYTFRSMQF